MEKWFPWNSKRKQRFFCTCRKNTCCQILMFICNYSYYFSLENGSKRSNMWSLRHKSVSSVNIVFMFWIIKHAVLLWKLLMLNIMTNLKYDVNMFFLYPEKPIDDSCLKVTLLVLYLAVVNITHTVIKHDGIALSWRRQNSSCFIHLVKKQDFF